MNKKIISVFVAAAALTAALSGCSLTGEEDTSNNVSAPAPVMNVLGEYAPLGGFMQYQSPDGGFSIQLTEGSVVNDADPNDVTMTIASAYTNADMLNVSKATGVSKVETSEQLYTMLKDDSSIDITGFFVLNLDGSYKGYKYTYTSVENAQLKGIVSTYFNADGSAYVVNATINNGNDERNVETINTIVDTFVTYL